MNAEPDLLPTDEKLDGQLAFFPGMEPSGDSDVPIPIDVPRAGMTDIWRIRILAADILLRFHGILPQDWLYEILVTSGHINYFQYADSVGALLDSASMVETRNEDGELCYALTESGIQYAKRLRLYVPKVVRDQVHLTALRYTARKRALRDLQIHVEPGENGCMLCLQCMERDNEMFFLRMQASTEENAEMLSERILRNPVRFFGKLIDLALTNEEDAYDLSNN